MMVWTIHEGLDKYSMQWNEFVHHPLQVCQTKTCSRLYNGLDNQCRPIAEATAGLGKDPRLVYDM